MEPNENIPVEHQNVPVEHRGLHDFLYNGDEHVATVITTQNLDGALVLPLEAWCQQPWRFEVARTKPQVAAQARHQGSA